MPNASKSFHSSRVSLKRPKLPKRHSSRTHQTREDPNLNHPRPRKWSDPPPLPCRHSIRRRRAICASLCATRTTSCTSSKSFRSTDRTLSTNTAVLKYQRRLWPIWQSNRRPTHQANRVLHPYISTLTTNFPKSSMSKASKKFPLMSIESSTMPSTTNLTKSHNQRHTTSQPTSNTKITSPRFLNRLRSSQSLISKLNRSKLTKSHQCL